MPFLLAFWLYCVIALVALIRFVHVSYLEPPVVSLVMWFVSSSVLLSGLIDYGPAAVLTPYSFSILIACTTALVLGALTVRRYSQAAIRGLGSEYGIRPIPRVLHPLFSILGLVFALIVFADAKSILESGPLDLQQLKNIYWDYYSSGSYTSRALVLAITRPFAFILAISLPYALSKMRRRTFATVPFRFLSLLSWISIVVEDVAKGKRGMTVLLIICTAAFFALTTAIRRADSLRLRGLIKALGKGKAFSATVVGILLVYFTFGIFPALKNPDLSSDTVNKWLSFITRGGVVNQHVTDLERNLQVPYLSTFAYGASYISTPIVTFTYFMEDTDVSEWYLMGSHNLPQFSRILSYIGGNRSGFISTRERIEAVSAYGRNPFKTGVTDMIMDFSIVGAVMLMFLLGWLSQILFATCLRTRHQELVVAYSLVVSYLVAFPLFSLSYVGPFSNTLMLVLAISGVRSLSIALSRAAAGVRETRILARRDAENPS